MKKFLRNERGNIAIFVLGLLAINMVLFVFVINLGTVFATKEKSSTISQQASMVATSVFYEEVRRVIYEYEHETLEGVLKAFFENIEDKVNDRKQQLSNSDYYTGWSNNEIELEAFDQVLSQELNKTVVRKKLKELLRSEPVENKVIQSVKNTIKVNDGLLEGAQLKIENNKFFVRASYEFKSITFKDSIDDYFKENIYQSSAGPKIDFLEVVWTKPKSIYIEAY